MGLKFENLEITGEGGREKIGGAITIRDRRGWNKRKKSLSGIWEIFENTGIATGDLAITEEMIIAKASIVRKENPDLRTRNVLIHAIELCAEKQQGLIERVLIGRGIGERDAKITAEAASGRFTQEEIGVNEGFFRRRQQLVSAAIKRVIRDL